MGEEFCPALGIAIPVGKDSLSMQTRWQEGDDAKAVVFSGHPSRVRFAPVLDTRLTVTPELKDRDDSLLVLLDLGSEQTVSVWAAARLPKCIDNLVINARMWRNQNSSKLCWIWC